ncbi:Ldh family oxidoreductase [Bacillus sp. 1P02SD]|uniref:Ldh family oxidoreductase n=1 Tax=Bacillus sp. 1P02SD TaxID=3132264 RepID=UPI0039A2B25F
MTNNSNIQSEDLVALCTEILKKQNMPERDALITAKSLVDADLNGISSHGVMRLPLYLKCLQESVFESNPQIKIVKETKSTALLDGGNGLGQVVSQKAVDLILEKIKETEIVAISVRNSNHFGAAAYWANQLQEHNIIGISASNVPPIMPAPGGAEARVGNNPISIAIPTDKEAPPIILDMATSTVPFGKILNAKSKGEMIPEGWAINSSGQPTTNPDEVLNGGSLFPVGGPKGYGLSVIIEVLSALLSDGAIGSDIRVLHNTPSNVSHFFLGIRIDAFMNPAIFKSKVSNYIQFIKSSKLAVGVDEVYLPGELEFRRKEENVNGGVNLPTSVITELIAFSKSLNVEEDLIKPFYQISKK